MWLRFMQEKKEILTERTKKKKNLKGLLSLGLGLLLQPALSHQLNQMGFRLLIN